MRYRGGDPARFGRAKAQGLGSCEWPLRSSSPRSETRSERLDTVLIIHDRLSITVLLFMGAVGLWGLFTFARGGILDGPIGGSLVIGQILVGAQGVAGL